MSLVRTGAAAALAVLLSASGALAQQGTQNPPPMAGSPQGRGTQPMPFMAPGPNPSAPVAGGEETPGGQGQGRQDQSRQNQGQAADSQGGADAAKAERHFLLEQTQDSAYLLALAKLARSKATRQDVKDHAKQVIADHDQYQASLRRLGKDRGIALPTGMDPRQQRQLDGAQKLSGAAFDRAYVAAVIRVNERDEQDAKKEAEQVRDPRAKRLIESFASKSKDDRQKGQALAHGRSEKE